MKRFVLGIMGLIAGSSFLGTAAEISGDFDSLDGPNVAARQVSPISFADLQAFSVSTSWINPAIPEFYAALPAPTLAAPVRHTAMMTGDYSKESLESPPVSVGSRYYATGEVGAFYGTSIGHGGGSSYGGYILGEVGNEHTQITAGASWETTTLHVPSHFGH